MNNLSTIPEGILADIRKWRGGIDDKFSNIYNLVNILTEHKTDWEVPEQLLENLTENRRMLQYLISLCKSTAGSTNDRGRRNTLLNSTVQMCLLQAKVWAYQAYVSGTITLDNVHSMGFLMPGETGGRHKRAKATDVLAEVKVKVINEDFVRVTVDCSEGKNAAMSSGGWPKGVNTALIVITAADGVNEVCRLMTDRLNNDINMPKGSHGRQFIIKASFLRHVGDNPRFGNEQTFSMPLTTEDLIADRN
jgi:hypothetical protein